MGYSVPTSGLVVGRGVECRVRLDFPRASVRQCRIISNENDEHGLEDTSSSHTHVNDKTIYRNEIVPLKGRDKIRLTK